MIDLRSDTVTRPSTDMRAAVAAAEVGDDVWGDDPTVAELERTVAGMLGTETSLFVTSGTQSNLCALLAHCARGDEYVAGENAHMYRYEAGGGAVLGSIQPQPVRQLDDGRLDLDHVRAVIKPDDVHFARTRLLCLENTTDGQAIGLDHHRELLALADEHDLALHLDGARLWNAAEELSLSLAELAAGFDTVSVCLSKGLGAPLGSVLAGSDELVSRARRWRKMLGGGLRQSGMMAAAGLHALANNLDRFGDDHRNAARLAKGLAAVETVTVTSVATNMVFLTFEVDPAPLLAAAARADVKLAVSGRTCRLVTHLDIDEDDVDTVVDLMAESLTR